MQVLFLIFILFLPVCITPARTADGLFERQVTYQLSELPPARISGWLIQKVVKTSRQALKSAK